MCADAIGNVSPVFEKDAAGAVLSGDVEDAFEGEAVVRALAGVGQHFVQRLGGLPRALHQFFPRRRRVADTAFDFITLNFEWRVGRKFGGKAGGSFLNRLEFRPPGAPDGDAACIHGDGGPISAVYWEMRGSLRTSLHGLRKRRGKS